MAQRYGRKRRRAHRAQIEQLSNIVAFQTMTAKRDRQELVWAEAKYQRLVHMMADWDNDVRGMFGPYSALLFKLGEFNTGFQDPTEVHRLPVPNRLMPQFHLSEMMPETIEMRVAYLRHCLFTVYEDQKAFGELATYMRLRISGHKDSVYAFSDAYWRRFEGPYGPPRREVYRLAEEIAKVMLAHIKKPEPAKAQNATE